MTKASLFSSPDGTERRPVVSLGTAEEHPRLRQVVAEDADRAVLNEAAVMGRGLFIAHLVDAKTEIRRFGMSGRPAGIVTLPDIATAGGFQGRPRDSEAFFGFTAFAAPTAVHQHDTECGGAERFQQAGRLSSNASTARRNGRRCRSLTCAARTLRSLPDIALWLRGLRNSSGSLCQPDPPRLGGAGRGYGNRRHPRWWRIRGSLASRAGEVANKQNSFYDFIAAGGVLKKSGITSSDGLAIQGESNGSSRIAE